MNLMAKMNRSFILLSQLFSTFCQLLARALFAVLSVSSLASAQEMDREGWMTFKDSGGRITFAVQINEVTATAVLDTGADLTMISGGLAVLAGIKPRPGHKIEMVGVLGRNMLPLSDDFSLRIGDTVVPVSGVPIGPNASANILLGRAIFELGVVQIDYPNQRIRFLNRDVVNFQSNIKMRRGRNGAPYLEMKINGEAAWLLLDTGNAATTILKKRFVKHNDLEQFAIDNATLKLGGVITTGDAQLLNIPHCVLGPYEIESFLASYFPERNEGLDGQLQNSGSRIQQDISEGDGILGYEVLKNFLVTMDLKDKKLNLYLP